MGPAAASRLGEEADRYGAHSRVRRQLRAPGREADRHGHRRADRPAAIATALERWSGAVDEVVLRAITANDTLDENIALVRAAKPA